MNALPGLDGQPVDASWRPSDRDLAWLKLYGEHRGKIDVAFGKLAYSGPPLAKIRSLDAKVTTPFKDQLQRLVGDLTKAGAGEVLVSSTVKDLVAGSGLRFRARGSQSLKGIPGEWHIFAAEG